MPALRIVLAVQAKKMWPRVTAYAILGIASALVAAVFGGRIPPELSEAVDADTARNILAILASSMLAVTTFSLSTMVSAYSAATANVTPRANRLITEDKTARNALSTFLGTFVFSLVGIIALNMRMYGGGGRFILFVVTIGVVLLILVTMIRWIERLTCLGQVGETSLLVEKAASRAMAERARHPTMGARRLEALPDAGTAGCWLTAEEEGYIQYVSVSGLSRQAEAADADVHVTVLPGRYAARGERLAFVEGEVDEAELSAMRACFVTADQRSFDQDPRYGVCVLTEIASRAANDNGETSTFSMTKILIYAISIKTRR